jgi:hypothetical protein
VKPYKPCAVEFLEGFNVLVTESIHTFSGWSNRFLKRCVYFSSLLGEDLKCVDTYRKRVYVIMNQPISSAQMPRVKGVPADRDEIKDRHNVMVSPSAWKGLDAIAKELGYKSRSDLIEAVGRREVEAVRKQANPNE